MDDIDEHPDEPAFCSRRQVTTEADNESDDELEDVMDLGEEHEEPSSPQVRARSPIPDSGRIFNSRSPVRRWHNLSN